MPQIRWIADAVPASMKIRQVYCVMFDRQGRVLVRVIHKPEGGVRYSLAGGRPEPFDADPEATCRRELLEEVNTEIETPLFIGYQLVNEEDGTPPYAQVRMAALIRKIGIKRPDPDNGKTYDRLLVPPDKAAFLLNWGDVGRQQLLAAQQAIYPLYNITEPTFSEEWV